MILQYSHNPYVILILFAQIYQIFCDLNSSNGFVDKQTQLYYQAPILNVANMNLTLGLNVPISKTRGTFLYQAYEGTMIAALCQADQINQGLYDVVNFTGTLNMAVHYYFSNDDVGQNSAFSLVQTSIYNKTTKESISDKAFHNLAGLIGTISSGINRVNADLSEGFSIPFINPGSLNQAGAVDNFAIVSTAENRTYFELRNTVLYSVLNAVLDLMAAYNWTLAANIYQSDVLGLGAQQNVQLYKYLNSSPMFPYAFIITESDVEGTGFFDQVCISMASINKLNLLILWTTQPIAYTIILKMKKYCKAAEKFVYIVTDDTAPVPSAIYDNDTDFKSVLLFRPFGPLNFTSFLNKCRETASPQAKKAIETSIADVLLNAFNCYERTENLERIKDIDVCDTDVLNRDNTCICSGVEFDPRYNPYSSQNFFGADAVTNFAYVISLLQQNCTRVNELLAQRGDKIVGNLDLCNFENITPAILTGLLVLTDYVGYTGPISYPSSLLNFRSIKSYYLYSIKTTLRDAKLVGNFSITGVDLDYASVSLPSGNDTISKLVPQNPDLNYASVAVFFGILIFLLVVNIAAFIILLIWKDHVLIRRNTPNISIVVLIGAIMINISGILGCLEISSALCILTYFGFAIGLATMYGGIMAKEYRLYRIFSNRTASAVKIDDRQLFLIIAAITAYFTALSIAAWICGLSAKILQSESNPFYLYYSCSYGSKTAALIIDITAEVSFICLQICTAILAFKIRKISTTYSESNSVFIVIILLVCINVIMIPLYETLRDGTDSAVVRRTIRLIRTCMILAAVSVFIFYYRFWLVYKYEKKLRNRENQNQTSLRLSSTISYQ